MLGRKKSSGRHDRDLIVGLDLGTTKTSIIIAERRDGAVTVAGLGTSPARGMKQGMIVNIEQTVQSIAEAVEAAEKQADAPVAAVYAGIAGDHIRSVNSRGMIAVGRSKNGAGAKITEEDISRVIETAQTVTFPADREVLHVIPQDFLVDDRTGFKDPVGIVGTRLEANVHIITGAMAAVQTIAYCLEEAGLQLEDLVLQPLASSLAVLTEDEQERGVTLMDLGGGTADLAVFYDGAIHHTAVIGLGGENVTRDLAHGLRTPIPVAEKIKCESGCAHPSRLSAAEPIVLPGGDGHADRQVAQDIVCAIIQPRMEEIFDLALKELRQADCLPRMSAGVVLTGGGALLPGALDVAEEVFNLPVRLGKPQGLAGLRDLANSPIHATGAGLVLYALQQMASQAHNMHPRKPGRLPGGQTGGRFTSFRRWLGELF
ncbi:MAG: cell division protein FtsA [Candidatus Zixiibacteriota bacterium]|nr:MAG: cell division protein FtsA [candidate division Zixibacteria bacterium]